MPPGSPAHRTVDGELNGPARVLRGRRHGRASRGSSLELYSDQNHDLMSSTMTTKGSYDATRRRERAEEERRATRLRVVEAARRLFLARGYVATTVADIAKEAGVALQSVYNAGRSKADRLQHVPDLAVARDD